MQKLNKRWTAEKKAIWDIYLFYLDSLEYVVYQRLPCLNHWRRSNKTYDLINSLYYHYSEIEPVVTMSKEELLELFDNLRADRFLAYYYNPDSRYFRKSGSRRWGYYNYYGKNVKRCKFTRDGHVKKPISPEEQNKREWKKLKGKKSNKSRGYYRKRSLRWQKKEFHKSERAWIKKMISRGDWDNFHNKNRNCFGCSWDLYK